MQISAVCSLGFKRAHASVLGGVQLYFTCEKSHFIKGCLCFPENDAHHISKSDRLYYKLGWICKTFVFTIQGGSDG